MIKRRFPLTAMLLALVLIATSLSTYTIQAQEYSTWNIMLPTTDLPYDDGEFLLAIEAINNNTATKEQILLANTILNVMDLHSQAGFVYIQIFNPLARNAIMCCANMDINWTTFPGGQRGVCRGCGSVWNR